MKQLQGKNALLTGGSMGLGPYMAKSLAREGVNIALTARSRDKLEEVAADLQRFGVKVRTFPADINDETSRQQMLDDVKAAFVDIDLLINNAGIEWISSFADLGFDDIGKLLQTNLVSPLLLTRSILPDMLQRGSGHIVTISSVGGKKGQPYSAPYAATKAGLIAWTSSLRAELSGSGVSASVVCPGFISDAGMFAVYNKKAPRISGESKPEAVGNAVIKVIQKDLQEMVVNSNSIFPMMLLDAIHPGIMTAILKKFGVHDFYRDQALENQRQRQEQRN